MTDIILNEPPSLSRCYLKLIFGKRAGVPADGRLPEIKITMPEVSPSMKFLKQFNQLCHFPEQEFLPVTFPYILAGPLHLAMMSHPEYPVKAAGLLHLRNRIIYPEKISTAQAFALSVQTSVTRFRPQGFEFDIITTAKIDNEVYWECISTFLKRGKFSREDPASEGEDIFKKLERTETATGFSVPGNAGRAYAALCKDFNPIHIATPSAWFFGMKKSIAHGMWVSARALGELGLTDIKSFDVAFKGPVYTGSKVCIEKDNGYFSLYCPGNNRPVILGKFS